MQGWALTRQNLDLGLPQPFRWLVLEFVLRPSLHRSLTCQVLTLATCSQRLTSVLRRVREALAFHSLAPQALA